MFGTFLSCWTGSALSSLHAPTCTKRSESTCSTAPQLQQGKAGMSRALGNLLCRETRSFSAPWMCSTEFSTSALLTAGCTKIGRNRGWLQSGHCCTHHRLSAWHGQGEHRTGGQEAEERWWGHGRPLPASSATEPWGLVQQRSCGTSTLQETGGGRLAAVPKGTEGAQQGRAEAHSEAAPDKHIGVVCLP